MSTPGAETERLTNMELPVTHAHTQHARSITSHTHTHTHTHSMDCISPHLNVGSDQLHRGYSLELQVSFLFSFKKMFIISHAFIKMHELEQAQLS